MNVELNFYGLLLELELEIQDGYVDSYTIECNGEEVEQEAFSPMLDETISDMWRDEWQYRDAENAEEQRFQEMRGN